MKELADAVAEAVRLIVTLDPEIVEITGRSLMITVSSCTIAALFCLPAGSLIHFWEFPGKRYLVSLVQTMFSLPTVVIGLIVFVLFSNAGVFGPLGLLFTPVVIVIGQVILVTPIMLGLTLSALSGADRNVSETARSLGASRRQIMLLTLREARFAIMTAVVLAFGRAISEVGLSLIVGGNIKGFTRTLTTAISLETSKGHIELSLALGMILVLIAFVVNIALNRLQQKR